MHKLRNLYPPIVVNFLSIKPTGVDNGNIRQTGFGLNSCIDDAWRFQIDCENWPRKVAPLQYEERH